MDEIKIIHTDPNDQRTPEEAGDDLIQLDGLSIICTRDKKNRRVVPAEIMDEYYKVLPDGTVSPDGRRTCNGGTLHDFDMMPEERKREIQTMGANALNAAHAQRRSMADTIDVMLRSKAGIEEIEKYNLPANATKQEALVAAMYAEAINKGTVRAFDSLRDTVGEKPIDKQQIDQQNTITEADRQMIAKVIERLSKGD